MRVIVFFDLPVETAQNRRDYRAFRKFLIRNGFLMLQESVYAKLALNSSQATQIASEVRQSKPEQGLVQILTVTEKQFAKMECISGQIDTDLLTSDERLVII